MLLARFKLAILSTAWKESHAYGLYDVHLNWQLLHDSPNCQIKMTAKYSSYTVTRVVTNVLYLRT